MYAEDSFFTLTVPGQIGLLILSTVMALACAFFVWRFTRARALSWRLLITAVVYFAFVWLAPQLYYTYYIYLLDGLPWQVVVQEAPTPWYLGVLMTFQERANTSYHAQGVLGWMLFLVAVFSPSFKGFGRKERPKHS